MRKKTGHAARSGTPAEAVKDADIVLLAVHWSRVDDVIGQAGNLAGKFLISCSLPMKDDDSSLAVGHTRLPARKGWPPRFQRLISSSFSSTPSEVLSGVFDAKATNPKPTLVYCGNDAPAKSQAARPISDLGFEPLDASSLATARYIEPFLLLVAQIAYEGTGGPRFSIEFNASAPCKIRDLRTPSRVRLAEAVIERSPVCAISGPRPLQFIVKVVQTCR